MKTYNIANPSDAYTLQSDDFMVACVTVAILGNGAYGIEGSPVLFGWDNFFEAHKIKLENYIDENHDKIIACMDSVLIGTEADRKMVEETLAMLPQDKHEEWLAKWHDKKRGSMNDIGKRAKMLAKAMRDKKC